MCTGLIAFLIMYPILNAGISNDDPNKAAIVIGVSLATWLIVGGIFVIF